MSHESATTAPRTRGLSVPPFHDPFHACLLAQADGLGGSIGVTPFLTEVNGTRPCVVCRGFAYRRLLPYQGVDMVVLLAIFSLVTWAFICYTAR